MEFKIHSLLGRHFAEVQSETIVLQSEKDALSLMEELYSAGGEGVLIHQKNLPAEFFDLKTGLAGAILQKFAQYRLPIAVVGDFSHYESRALQAFIYESNRGNEVFFLGCVDQALQKLAECV